MHRGVAIAAVFTIAGCDFVLRLDDLHPPPPVTSYRKAIAITSDAVLSDVPVSIALAGDADLVAHAQADGSDLVFGDGTSELASEVVSYSAGTLDAWVRVPALAPGMTTIYLGYGGAARTTAASAVWPPEYLGVWHQSDAETTARDSTVHAHDLVAEVTAPASLPGVVGGAREYGPTRQDMCVGDADASLEFAATSSFAYSVWVYEDQAPTPYNVALAKGGGSQFDPGFDLELGGAWAAYVADELGNTQNVVPAATAPKNRWAQVVIVVDRGNAIEAAYLDGSPVGTKSLVSGFGSLASSTPFCLGGSAGGASWYNGRLDEARVVSGIPSDARIRFEHENLATRDQVISIGFEELVR